MSKHDAPLATDLNNAQGEIVPHECQAADRLAFAIHASGAGTWEIRQDRSVPVLDARSRELLGIEDGLLAETPEAYLALIHPDDRQVVVGAFMHGRASAERFEVTFRLADSTTGTRYVRAHAMFEVTEGSEPGDAFGILLDVTAEELARRETEEDRDTLRRSLDAVSAGAWQLRLPSRAVTWDEQMCRIFGVDRAPETAEGWDELVHPEDRASLSERFDRALAERSHFEATFRAIRPDGTTIHVRSSAVIHFGADDEPVHAFGACSDVTGEEQLKRELRESQQRLSLALMAASGGAWRYDYRRDLCEWDDRMKEIFGVEQAPRSAQEWRALHHPDDVARIAEARETSLKTGKPFDLVYRAIRSDGGVVYIRSTAVVDFDEEKQPRHAFGACFDVTDDEQAKQELRDSKKRYELALDGGRLGTWDWWIAKNECSYDDRWYTMLGYEPGELANVPDTWNSLIHPEDEAKTIEALAAYTRGEAEHYEAEHRLRRKDGSWAWILTSGKIFDRAENGTPLRITGTHLDITDQKLRDERLRESESRFRRISDNTPIGIFTAVGDQGLTWANRWWTKFLGVSLDEILGDKWTAFIHPDDLGPASETYTLAYERSETLEIEARWRTRHRGERTVLIRSVPNFSPDGRYNGHVGTCVDITDERQREAEIRESEARFRRMADQAPIGVFVTDTTGLCTWVNRWWAEFVGHSQSDAGSCMSLAHPDDLPRLTAVLQRAVERREPFDTIGRFMTTDRTYRDVHVRAAPSMDESGGFVGHVGTCTDITDTTETLRRLDEANHELERANEDLAQFASVASHDLQAPLRTICGYIDLVENQLNSKGREELEEAGRFLAAARDAADRSRKLIRALLEYAHVGARDLSLRPVDPREVIDAVLGLARETVEGTETTVEIKPLPMVSADPDLLAHVFQNIVNNAVGFTAAHRTPHIVVTTAQKDAAWVEIRVADNGPGVEENLRDRIFQPFERGLSRSNGAGIGLAICSRIVTRHGGRIWVEPNQPTGSVFCFTVPAVDG